MWISDLYTFEIKWNTIKNVTENKLGWLNWMIRFWMTVSTNLDLLPALKGLAWPCTKHVALRLQHPAKHDSLPSLKFAVEVAEIRQLSENLEVSVLIINTHGDITMISQRVFFSVFLIWSCPHPSGEWSFTDATAPSGALRDLVRAHPQYTTLD